MCFLIYGFNLEVIFNKRINIREGIASRFLGILEILAGIILLIIFFYILILLANIAIFYHYVSIFCSIGLIFLLPIEIRLLVEGK